MTLYNPINSSNQEFRLLKLAPGSFEDQIRITLVPARLTDAPSPQYEALSYVWGREDCPTPALVNDCPFTITANLDDALRTLRDNTVERALWVDAVCINTRDHDEKSGQVRLMSGIYSTATKVVVWMGLSDQHSDLVVDCVNEQRIVEWEEMGKLFEAVSAFCSRPWFTRIWVIQEFGLARIEPCVVIGRRSTNMSGISSLVSCLNHAFGVYSENITVDQAAAVRQWSPFLAGLAKSAVFWLDHIPSNLRQKLKVQFASNAFMLKGLLQLRLERTWTKKGIRTDENGQIVSTEIGVGHSSHFPHVLSRVARLESTHPCDKIFGMLGLCDFWNSPILPNYSLSGSEVYSQAMAHIVTDPFSGFLQGYPIWPVGIDWADSAEFPLPSWVPDFSRGSFWHAQDHGTLGGLRRMCNQDALLEAIKSTSRSFPFASFMNRYQTLCVGGVDIGEVCQYWELRQRGCEAIEEDLSAILDDVRQTGISTQVLLDAFVASSVYSTTQLSETQDWEPHGDPVCAEGSWEDLSPNLEIAALQSPGRILFLTDTGRVGVTEGPVEKGDLVVGLFGVNFPAILRYGDESCSSFKMVNIAHVACHVLGHEQIPRDVDEADLLGEYGFNMYIIN